MTARRAKATLIVLTVLLSSSAVAQKGLPAELTITGLVVEASDGAPVPFSKVDVTAADRGDPLGGRSARADGQGRFTIDRLRSADYYLAASKPGYATSYYDADGASTIQPGTPLTLKTSSQAAITIRLVKGGVVTGRVVDAFGSPAIRSPIELERIAPSESVEWRFSHMPAQVTTNARGEYRAFGLAPGEYRVSVASGTATATAVGSAGSRPMKLVRTFYPGVVDPGSARAITVLSGVETAGIDIALQLHPVFTVSGRVEGREGGRSIPVRLSGPLSSSAIVNDDGAFRFGDAIIPGRYRLTSWIDAPNAEGVRWGASDIAVTDRDIDDALLVLQPAMTASGRVERADGQPLGLAMVHMIPEVDNGLFPSGGAVSLAGTFLITKLMSGRYRITVSSRAETLAAAVTHDGHELPGGVIEITAGQNVTGLVIRIR